MRIRPEIHKMKSGDVYCPRHHSLHYHVEYRINSGGWANPENVIKFKPQNYKPGDGTGFLPGEFFPGS